MDRVGFGIGDDEIDEVVMIGGNDEGGDGLCDVGIVCGDTFKDEKEWIQGHSDESIDTSDLSPSSPPPPASSSSISSLSSLPPSLGIHFLQRQPRTRTRASKNDETVYTSSAVNPTDHDHQHRHADEEENDYATRGRRFPMSEIEVLSTTSNNNKVTATTTSSSGTAVTARTPPSLPRLEFDLFHWEDIIDNRSIAIQPAEEMEGAKAEEVVGMRPLYPSPSVWTSSSSSLWLASASSQRPHPLSSPPSNPIGLAPSPNDIQTHHPGIHLLSSEINAAFTNVSDIKRVLEFGNQRGWIELSLNLVTTLSSVCKLLETIKSGKWRKLSADLSLLLSRLAELLGLAARSNEPSHPPPDPTSSSDHRQPQAQPLPLPQSLSQSQSHHFNYLDWHRIGVDGNLIIQDIGFDVSI